MAFIVQYSATKSLAKTWSANFVYREVDISWREWPCIYQHWNVDSRISDEPSATCQALFASAKVTHTWQCYEGCGGRNFEVFALMLKSWLRGFLILAFSVSVPRTRVLAFISRILYLIIMFVILICILKWRFCPYIDKRVNDVRNDPGKYDKKRASLWQCAHGTGAQRSCENDTAKTRRCNWCY